jgi:hypothetical protein
MTHSLRTFAPAHFMLEQSPQVLSIAGLEGNGEQHWQTAWESVDPTICRVSMGDHSRIDRNRWVNRLNLAIERATEPVVLVAHGAGCMTVAWWAHYTQPSWADPVLGALLVAPPQVDSRPYDARLSAFSPAPMAPLPFPSILVASHDDPWASFEHSKRLAAFWGSELHDAGASGHIDDGSEGWPEGRDLLARLRNNSRDQIDQYCSAIEASPLSLFA